MTNKQDGQDNYGDETVCGVKPVSKHARKQLNPRQIEDYRSHRTRLIRWMDQLGKDPERAEGYARETVKQRAYRLDRFYRHVWNELEDGYTTQITTDHADEYMRHMAIQDHSLSYKTAMQKAVKTLFKFHNFQNQSSTDWDPDIQFQDDSASHNPRDFLTDQERRKIREASLEHGSVPHYTSVTPEERDKWKQYLAQRFGKPKSEIGVADWKRANSFKIPSLINTSLDAGLRPVEVGRAKTTWVDAENGVLRIPKEESSKNKGNWVVSLREQTARCLEKWLEERSQRDKYTDSDKLWLTRHSNPYGSKSLNRLLDRLLETAEIERENITWYSIRHSTATFMAREEGLAAAQSQLRHKSIETTMRYDQAPVKDRRDALNRMG
jgi:site-specific recombinase XerD